MGVKGLHSYLQRKHPNAHILVDINALAKEHDQQHSTNPVTMVVDARNCICEMISSDDYPVCGGQFMQLNDRIRQFVNAFKSLDIKLVFIFGKANPEKLAVDNYRKTEEIKNIFLGIQNGKCKYMYWPPKGDFQCASLIALYINDPYVEIYKDVEDDTHVAISQYANDNHCLAILSDTTDFIIYDTVPVMSYKDLDLRNMTTKMYKKEHICSILGISKTNLPILASLIGNNTISSEILGTMHQYIFQKYTRRGALPYYRAPIEQIVKYVQQHQVLSMIINDVRIHAGVIISDHFKKSVNSYHLGHRDLENFRPLTAADEMPTFKTCAEFIKHVKSQAIATNITSVIWNVLNSKIISCPKNLEDASDTTLANSRELWRSARQAFYGLVLNSSGIEKRDVCEDWALLGKEYGLEIVPTNNITHNGVVVSMIDLWNAKASPSEENSDFQTISLLLCFGLPESALQPFKEIPAHLQALCVIINVMSQHPKMQIGQWEIQAFLVQAILPNAKQMEHWQNMEFSSLESKACHLAALFLQGVISYWDIQSACGLPIGTPPPSDYFDGKRFQHCYQEMKKGILAHEMLSHNEDSNVLMKTLLSFVTIHNNVVDHEPNH